MTGRRNCPRLHVTFGVQVGSADTVLQVRNAGVAVFGRPSTKESLILTVKVCASLPKAIW